MFRALIEPCTFIFFLFFYLFSVFFFFFFTCLHIEIQISKMKPARDNRSCKSIPSCIYIIFIFLSYKNIFFHVCIKVCISIILWCNDRKKRREFILPPAVARAFVEFICAIRPKNYRASRVTP